METLKPEAGDQPQKNPQDFLTFETEGKAIQDGTSTDTGYMGGRVEGDVSKQFVQDSRAKQLTDTLAELQKEKAERSKVFRDYKKISTDLKDLTSRFDKLESDLPNVEKEVNKIFLRSIELIGFFVTIFSFLSVDVQVLRTSSSLMQASGLIMISASLLLFFVCLLHILISDWIHSGRDYEQMRGKAFPFTNLRSSLLTVSFLLLLLGVGVFLLLQDPLTVEETDPVSNPNHFEQTIEINGESTTKPNAFEGTDSLNSEALPPSQ